MKETPLLQAHKAHHAKLVDFAGWMMPIQYTGVLEEYHAVRHAVGLFDVSHMGRFQVTGPQAEGFLQWITTNDVGRLKVGQAQYSMVCNNSGGILDDIFLYKTRPDTYLICANASNREKILHWFMQHHEKYFPHVHIQDQSAEMAQIAIQGPDSHALLEKLLGSGMPSLKPRECSEISGGEYSGLLSRTGYTGEVGYEWYLPAAGAVRAWGDLLKAGAESGTKPAGLGSRDLLRLDVGYLLYGNDIDESRTPLEANAGWVVAWDKGEFQGRHFLRSQKEKGLTRQLVGLEMQERGIPRHGMTILQDGEAVGKITSGNFSPILQKGIGMGYVPVALGQEETNLKVDIRGKLVAAHVVKMPFYKRQQTKAP